MAEFACSVAVALSGIVRWRRTARRWTCSSRSNGIRRPAPRFLQQASRRHRQSHRRSPSMGARRMRCPQEARGKGLRDFHHEARGVSAMIVLCLDSLPRLPQRFADRKNQRPLCATTPAAHPQPHPLAHTPRPRLFPPAQAAQQPRRSVQGQGLGRPSAATRGLDRRRRMGVG